jgi:hypothetical protein
VLDHLWQRSKTMKNKQMPKCHITCLKKSLKFLCTKFIATCQQKSQNIPCKKIGKFKLLAQNHNYLQPKAKKTNNCFP